MQKTWVSSTAKCVREKKKLAWFTVIGWDRFSNALNVAVSVFLSPELEAAFSTHAGATLYALYAILESLEAQRPVTSPDFPVLAGLRQAHESQRHPSI